MSYLSQVKKATPQPPVVTIIGFPGVGKTSLAATFENPIFIQAENASTVFESVPEELQPAFLPQIPIANKASATKPSEVILAQLRELAQADHGFKTLVFDIVTAMNAMLENEIVMFDEKDAPNIMEAAGGFGKGLVQVAAIHAKIRAACEHLRKAKGMTIVFLAHSGIVKIKNRPDVDPYSTWSIDVPEATRKIYIAGSDAVLYMKTREYVTGAESGKKGDIKKYGRVVSTGERYLIAAGDGVTGYVDAKNRYNMPLEIEVEEGKNPLLQYIPYLNSTTSQQTSEE